MKDESEEETSMKTAAASSVVAAPVSASPNDFPAEKVATRDHKGEDRDDDDGVDKNDRVADSGRWRRSDEL